MSRFFARAGSDSDSDESDFSESDSDDQQAQDGADEGGDSDDSDDDGKGGDAKKAKVVQSGKSKYLRKDDSDDDDDDEDEGPRRATAKKGVLRSAQDKRYDDMRTIVRKLNNGKKINDWAKIEEAFKALNAAYAKTSAVVEREGGAKPRFYFRTLALLEDHLKDTLAPEKKDLVKKMNATNARALNAMKQNLKKHNKLFEADIESWRTNPVSEEQSAEEDRAAAAADGDDGGDESSNWDSDSDTDSSDSDVGGRKRTVLEKYGRRPAKAPKAESDKPKPEKKPRAPKKVQLDVGADLGEAPDDGLGGFTAVGEKGKIFDVNPENLYKKLTELLEARGKKSTDKAGQILNLTKCFEVANTLHQKVKVLLALIPAQFDHISITTGYMPVDVWKSCRANINTLFDFLDAHPNIIVSDLIDEDLDPAEGEKKVKEGENVTLRGSLFSFVDRLDEEFTKSLQNIDPHTTEYVERLRDETLLYVLIVRAQKYFERIKSVEAADLTSMRRVEHLYFKPEQVITVFEAALPTPSGFPAKELVHNLCVSLYQTSNIRTRARALLCHVYHLALNGKFHEARDMLLMSHLQEQAQHTDISTQILYNRTMVQLGLCAFRNGLIRDAANALQEISSSGKVKELLAQGYQQQRYSEKTPEQEKLEKSRQLPFHMHINLELLECVYLTCSMLLEVPNMAAHAHDSRRKIISKPFRRMLDYNERQVFLGPPENTRDHVMGASRALSMGEWQKCRSLITSIKIWDLMPNTPTILTMLGEKIQQEGLRTYLFQFSPFYDSMGLAQLADMFELAPAKVHSIVSKMILAEELNASLDGLRAAVVLHRPVGGVSGGEMSRLEYLAGVYSEKVGSFVDNNEKLLESRSIILGLQQQQQREAQAGDRGG
ncbi:Translation initiation factor 3 subunit c, partial [Irineochytrium annulatum]